MRNQEENHQIQQLVPAGMSHTSGFSRTRSPGPITARLHSETGDLVSRMDRENVWCIHGKTDSGNDEKCSDSKPFFCYDSECFFHV